MDIMNPMLILTKSWRMRIFHSINIPLRLIWSFMFEAFNKVQPLSFSKNPGWSMKTMVKCWIQYFSFQHTVTVVDHWQTQIKTTYIFGHQITVKLCRYIINEIRNENNQNVEGFQCHLWTVVQCLFFTFSPHFSISTLTGIVVLMVLFFFFIPTVSKSHFPWSELYLYFIPQMNEITWALNLQHVHTILNRRYTLYLQ